MSTVRDKVLGEVPLFFEIPESIYLSMKRRVVKAVVFIYGLRLDNGEKEIA